jgi:hypothetical protein
VNHKKLSFIDARVLIDASRGDSEQSKNAISVLDDPSREFISSLFVKLEVLPKAVYNKKKHEAEFYNAFFDSVSLWADDLDLIVNMANQKASARHLSDEEIQYITWEMNARYYNWGWLRYNKVKRLYPKWFAKEALRLGPFYAKRKAALALGLRTRRDFFREDLESGGEVCKRVS